MKKNLVRPNSFLSILLLSILVYALPFAAQAAKLDAAEKAIRLKMYDKAFALYSRAAKKGNPEAQYQLANMYKNGFGVAASDTIARQWLQRASKKGWPAAQFTLAMQLLNSNPEKAMDLIDQAAASNYSSAVLYVEQGLNTGDRAAGRGEVTDKERWFFAAKHGELGLLTSMYNKLKNVELADDMGNTAIFYAVQNDNLVSINWLISRGANVDRRNRFGETALFLAVAKKSTALLTPLLRRSKNVAQKLNNDDNLLHYAIRREANDVVAMLLQRKTLVNQLNKEGYTPRDLAVALNNQPLAARLASQGLSSNLNWQGQGGSVSGAGEAQKPTRLPAGTLVSIDVLTQVIANDNVALLDSLLKKNPQLVSQKLDSDESLVSFAVKNGNANIVKTLIKYRSPVTQADLNEAASHGDTETVIALMSAGVKPISSAKMDAVDIAIMKRQNKTLEAILQWLEQSSNIDKTKIFSKYALTAAKFNNDFAFEKFVDYARTDLTDDLNRNAIWYSAYNANVQHLKLLLSKGVSLDTPDKLGKTPLYVAIENNCQRCLKLLLPRSNVNRATETGQTPLMAAVYREDSSAVKALIDSGADVAQRNTLGNTALFAAVEVDSRDIVKFLIDSGASSIRKNNNGYSALDIAKQIRSNTLEVMQ